MSHSLKILSFLFISNAFFSCTASNDKFAKTETDSIAKLTITPKQCKEPWIGIEGGSLENKVSKYLKHININLISFEDATPKDMMMCEACEVCLGPTIIITVNKNHIKSLQDKGFSLVTDESKK
ncbi:hypothetical protein [Aquimarina aquimarini]|uniref:hypothetical protein n=1 Tax=Aquimarina aquimarini TaxID=1191734 RepID=UPI001F22A872|nr:hypothetical protein [Aquimarina aquimarini]